MLNLKPGGKWRSAVCETQVMVVKGKGEFDLCCGGQSMLAASDEAAGELDPAFASGSLMGKRYVNAAGDVELLCTKPGAGSLALAGDALVIKQTQALPSSD